MAKQQTLFGDEEMLVELKRTSRQETFEDYEGFLKKFDAKKTTDDCYTPKGVYEAVLQFIDTRIMPLEGVPVVRPFYPGGDYERFEYPNGCAVIDNPPFSLLSKICRFYSAHKVPFFLWGPALTLFTAPDCDLTYIIADCDITYENGAVVRTGFITNMIPDIRVWCCPELKNLVAKAQALPIKTKKGFIYPDNIITAATLGKITSHGVDLKIPKKACHYIKDADGAKAVGRSLFGGGYLLSTRAAAEKAAAEKAAAEIMTTVDRLKNEQANQERLATARNMADYLRLSRREEYLVQELDKQY